MIMATQSLRISLWQSQVSMLNHRQQSIFDRDQASHSCWLRILPLLNSSNIPHDDKHWQCYLLLLRIIEIALAPVVTTDLCAMLKVAIR